MAQYIGEFCLLGRFLTFPRWDLQMGQRGQLDRLPLAHTASVTSLDWCHSSGSADSSTGLGWIVSGGLDHTVKVWDLTTSVAGSYMQHKPTYTLHPSFPVKHVHWRPHYECEIAVVSNAEFGAGANPDIPQNHLSGIDRVIDVAGSPSTSIGDAVEIWDVRRGWIPKWRISGTSLDGGVTDITFGDSHAMWALHSTGLFSQLDLRDCIKPLDSMPRTAASWNAPGSLAFVTERASNWELPFDDIGPDRRSQNKIKPKVIGDRRFSPSSQSLGVYTHDVSGEDLDVFIRLAQNYVVDLNDRKLTCELNGEIAFEAKKYYVGQIWMLFAAALAEILPKEPPGVPSAPLVPFKFPPSPNLPSKKASPGRNSSNTSPKIPSSASNLTPRKVTPTSSATTSPLQILGSLPPITPTDPYLGRRPSVDSNASRGPSLYRRRSLSIHSSSPNDRNTTRLRHVGEGALDDSDSSASDGEATESSEEDFKSSLPTAGITPAKLTPAHPSPLSRLASRNSWTEDEDEVHDEDASSPSPQSTDSEAADSEESPRQPVKLYKRGSTKTRSRSSTVASLAAVHHRTVVQKPSQSSLRTVVATDQSIARDAVSSNEPETEERSRAIPSPSHQRQKSQAISELALNPHSEADNENPPSTVHEASERRPHFVRADERRIYDGIWNMLREALEDFANEGDIQTCAMLTLVASKELGINSRRSTRFLETYIDMLTRLQLHGCSANIRKLCMLEDIRKTTLVETTVHSSCGNCRKSLLTSWSNMGSNRMPYCSSCRAALATCSICRLPVRGLLFQCSVCSHGGHQLCYRRYYLQHPMTELARPLISPADTRGRSTNAEPQSTREKHTSGLFGHPCATGCGHFCWVSSSG